MSFSQGRDVPCADIVLSDTWACAIVCESHIMITMTNNLLCISPDVGNIQKPLLNNGLFFDMIHFLGAISNLDKTEIYVMKDLFRYVKEYAYFSVGNTKLYLLKEGFAMGSYDSGDGANLVLLKSEYFMLQDRKIVDNVINFFSVY